VALKDNKLFVENIKLGVEDRDAFITLFEEYPEHCEMTMPSPLYRPVVLG
jgi:hypothetical protein